MPAQAIEAVVELRKKRNLYRRREEAETQKLRGDQICNSDTKILDLLKEDKRISRDLRIVVTAITNQDLLPEEVWLGKRNQLR